MHNTQSVIEMHNLFCDFEIQTGHLIPARRPDLVRVKTKLCRIVDFDLLADHKVKVKESEESER